MSYTAPIKDIAFACNSLADLEGISQLPGFEEATADMLEAILQEAGKFGSEVLAPINHSGDKQGARLVDGQSVTADGWKEAYARFIESGWNGLPFDPEHGGQGLPWVIATAVNEIWHASNMAFALCPLLTQGAIEAVLAHGSEQLHNDYLAKLVSGEWTGTMNLTESQAGSDLAAVKTRAKPNGDHYLISGQKIFITYGDHDMTENIVHLVLARTPDAPQGVKGISLFIVPKFLKDDAGAWTIRNDVETMALEHKLSVGVQGYALADRAYQQAVLYANDRTQGSAVDDPSGAKVSIIHHPDVQRLLWTQKCRNESLRSLGLVVAGCMDKAARHPDPDTKAAAQEFVEVLIPVVKGYSTEIGLENVSLALQVHGGMGFIEETGAAQHYRDQRITPIYEGTTGIQAMDLVGRKLARDGGQMTLRVIEFIRAEAATFDQISADMADVLNHGLNALKNAATDLATRAQSDINAVAAVAEPYLRLWGVVVCGWQMAKATNVSNIKLQQGNEDPFYQTKIRTAEYYFSTEMPKIDYLLTLVNDSGNNVAGSRIEDFKVA